MPRKLFGPSATVLEKSSDGQHKIYVAGLDFEVSKKSMVFVYDE
jgi:hypothetical protein